MTNEAYDYNNPRSETFSASDGLKDQPASLLPGTITYINEEPSIEEHANMIRKGFDHILNKALESTELARRVAELEATVRQQVEKIDALDQAWKAEAEAHGETAKALQEVQGKLAQRESTVHDLVMERDIALAERNDAESQRDDALQRANDQEANSNMWERRFNEEQLRSSVLEERCNTMQLRVNAVKEAINGLHSL